MRIKSVPRTPQLNSFLKATSNGDSGAAAGQETVLAEAFTPEQLRDAWNAFAEQRKKLQAEYQLLSQPWTLDGNTIFVDLLNPVQETILDTIKSDLTTFVRERVRNTSIQVVGRVQENPEQRIIYTNREKFDFLAEKNPILKELKDRLGLDTDF